MFQYTFLLLTAALAACQSITPLNDPLAPRPSMSPGELLTTGLTKTAPSPLSSGEVYAERLTYGFNTAPQTKTLRAVGQLTQIKTLEGLGLRFACDDENNSFQSGFIKQSSSGQSIWRKDNYPVDGTWNVDYLGNKIFMLDSSLPSPAIGVVDSKTGNYLKTIPIKKGFLDGVDTFTIGFQAINEHYFLFSDRALNQIIGYSDTGESEFLIRRGPSTEDKDLLNGPQEIKLGPNGQLMIMDKDKLMMMNLKGGYPKTVLIDNKTVYLSTFAVDKNGIVWGFDKQKRLVRINPFNQTMDVLSPASPDCDLQEAPVSRFDPETGTFIILKDPNKAELKECLVDGALNKATVLFPISMDIAPNGKIYFSEKKEHKLRVIE
jgi:hypothetical protein